MSQLRAGTSAATPSAATFRSANRGGGLLSETVNQPVAALVALAAYRLGLAPTTLTMTGLTVGLVSSLTLTILAPQSAAGSIPAWALGLGVGLAWQIAYVFDCADGQLARVTGRTSAAGARLDILCDVATQISVVTALAVTAEAYSPGTPAWLHATFAGTWMINLISSVLASGPSAASLVTSTSTAIRVIKLVRDYGAVILACAVVVSLVPDQTRWLMAVLAAVNGLFLMASILQAARSSLRSR